MKRKLPILLSLFITIALVISSVIIIYAVSPRITRTDNIIKSITSFLKIDLDDNGATYSADDIRVIKFKLNKKKAVELKPTEKGKNHTAYYKGFILSVNSNAKDFKRKVKAIKKNKQAVVDKVDSVISSYDGDSISEIQVMNEVLDDLKDEYGKEMILNMEFTDFEWK